MTRTEQGRQDRIEQKQARERERQNRQLEALQRQKEANAATYGEGTFLESAANEKAARLYDLDTNELDPTFNKQTPKETIDDDGIDGFGTETDIEEAANIEFNGSVLICINGSPYWIDIPYSAPPYDGTGAANFPIEEP